MTAALPQPDLFGHRPKARYPDKPGWKGTDTSREAAESMADRDEFLKGECLRVLRAYGPKTSDEIAKILNEEPGSIRPRISELKNENPPRVRDTGERRRNKSGRYANVVEIVDYYSP